MSHDAHHEEGWFKKYCWSTDHKIIGFQYLFTGMALAVLGGFFAYAFRMQLGFPGKAVPGFGVVSPNEYNALVTNHGTIMIFWVAMPVLIAAFGNFLIPLMIGCDDMVFPRLNRLSYQIFLLSALVLLASMVVPGGGFGGAWTAYPPLSAKHQYSLTPAGSSLWLLAVALEFVAFLMGGINFVTTVMNSRAPGMKWSDIPVVIWMIVLASIIFMASVGPLVAGAVMLFFDQQLGTGFYDPVRGGDPILWQHLFWFFGHPEVYVVLLPAVGITIDVIATFARKKVFAYKTVLYTAFATGILSFFVWAHHQFIAGIDPRMANVFTVTTVLISVPIAEMMFVTIATLYGGSIRLTTPMLWALSFVAEFLIGGVTGIYLGSSGSDIYFHDTYFVLAHFHYTFVPIAIIGTFAGVTYWFPKMFGKMMDEKLGKLHFWTTIIPFNFIFIPLFITGAGGDHRRIFDYRAFPDLNRPEMQNLRMIATIATVAMLAAQVIFFYNFIKSIRSGKKADKNPWLANTLEWTVPSPPPHGNFAVFPNVYRGPYEYSVPGRKLDYWPQDEPPDDEAAPAKEAAE
ncbi:MAG: cbb3-type cytochrome c oxidase subunit I [Polyangiaceae bacterium]|nr:cbb3-type cytochrome c oxidase subunit I [Polyangiaceae bacterium]MCE7892969.1 cytochrome c oxidase subunit I [Sorangiineae bacterium PRO1]MCL4753824.1 cbb3-type cytochrome c oxidase subunit I [Myxococcales bacterium]